MADGLNVHKVRVYLCKMRYHKPFIVTKNSRRFHLKFRGQKICTALTILQER